MKFYIFKTVIIIIILTACSGIKTAQNSFAESISPDTQITNTPISLPTPTPVSLNQTPLPGSNAGSQSIGPKFISDKSNDLIEYKSQSGDSLAAVAEHFGVGPKEIISPMTDISYPGYLPLGEVLKIPNKLTQTSPSDQLIPDSEVVLSSSAENFDIQEFIKNTGGFLNQYSEMYQGTTQSGSQILQTVAVNHSTNPRLLLAVLEYQSRWVYSQSDNPSTTTYPIGIINPERAGLFEQLSWVAARLNAGYYGWREGSLTALDFPDGSRMRLSPTLNAGTVALQYTFSRLYNQTEWHKALYESDSLTTLYRHMFDDPWQRAKKVEPLIPAALVQPLLVLPFEANHTWNYTGGPHTAWGHEGVLAAIDFAPQGVRDCESTQEWVTSAAPGLVVRSEFGLVVVDLDGDGNEQTGWNLIYLHIATNDRSPAGEFVYTNDHIGHPSCEGGSASGTHVHFARKYNGEWILNKGPLPVVLSGWVAINGKIDYRGYLTKNGRYIIASQVSSAESVITRE